MNRWLRRVVVLLLAVGTAWFVRERTRGGAVPVAPAPARQPVAAPVPRPVALIAPLVAVPAPEPIARLVEPPIEEVVGGPHPGSAMPLAGGLAPSTEFVVKGNANSMIFHTPQSPSYARTVAEVWFRTEQDARAAGFRAPKRRGSA